MRNSLAAGGFVGVEIEIENERESMLLLFV